MLQNIVDFFVGARRGASTIHTLPRRHAGHVGRVRGKWGGVLLAQVTALFLGEGTRSVTMEIVPCCGAIYCVLDGVA